MAQVLHLLTTVNGVCSHTGGTFNAIGGSAAGIATLDVKNNVTKSATWQCTWY